jgi:hypothetical protein
MSRHHEMIIVFRYFKTKLFFYNIHTIEIQLSIITKIKISFPEFSNEPIVCTKWYLNDLSLADNEKLE